MRGFRAALVIVAALGALAAPQAALAQTAGPDAEASVSPEIVATAGDVAAALVDDPVYVDPDAEAALDEAEAAALREQIASVTDRTGPIYVAILPGSAATTRAEFASLLSTVGQMVELPGTYALIVGDALLAGATPGVGVDPERVPEIATQTVQAERGNGAAAVLESFVERLAAEAPPATGTDAPAAADDGGVSLLWLPVALAAVVVGGLALGLRTRRRRAAEDAAHAAELRRLALDDLVVLGDELRTLDLDTKLPSASEEARQRYAAALDAYTEASDRLDHAARPGDVRDVTARIDEGRHEIAAARALLDGRPVPQRRPPCFFDPRHGPSVADVVWTPPGGEAREIPVCAADATRLADGEEPQAREIEVDGRRMPYWNAPAWYGPWAGGYYGTAPGLLNGFVIGSLLSGGWGSGWGGWEGGAGDPGADGPGDDPWRGGFGGGDFGGGFGDFGGGDFG